MKSLDLSFQASIIPAKPKARGYIRANKAKKNLQKIAFVKPLPGKGFEFAGAVYPKIADLTPVLIKAGFHAYRQGAALTKKNGAANPTVILSLVQKAA